MDKMDKMFNRTQLDMAEYFDREVYLPVKEEIGTEITHSFGIKKEMFKQFVETKMEMLKNEIRKEYSI